MGHTKGPKVSQELPQIDINYRKMYPEVIFSMILGEMGPTVARLVNADQNLICRPLVRLEPNSPMEHIRGLRIF